MLSLLSYFEKQISPNPLVWIHYPLFYFTTSAPNQFFALQKLVSCTPNHQPDANLCFL
ncbi:hypothetical protein E1A91_A05G275500v1 [Gossypium mustelinum]|uniref:Uncharacterized protein n=1 Tax=Gossypium mustelinum TaxID=34275 RepID=A0A5D2ZBM8_GOSMU|nr:hypothetical protein E1A91_A05G275500v1 [Gossypium mustelinum]